MDKIMKGMLWFIGILFVVGMGIQLTSATEGSYVSVETPFEYISEISAGSTNYQEYSLELPNGVTNIASFVINVKGDWNAADVSIVIDTSEGDVDCNPTSWSTPDSYGYETNFDCTAALVNELKAGNLVVTAEDQMSADYFEVYDAFAGNSIMYSPGDIVEYDGGFYECAVQIFNYNGLPPALTGYWTYLGIASSSEITPGNKIISINGIGVTTSNTANNIHGDIKILYIDKGGATITVHGTEYAPGDRAKLWVQLIDADGEDVEDGACQLDIYTPVNTIFIENAAMTNMNHDGIYYYDLIAPQSHGVYPAIAKCYYDITTEEDNPDDFRLIVGDIDNGDYEDTDEIDGVEHKIEQDGGELEFEYDIERMCGVDVSEVLLTGVTISVNAKWTASVTNDNIIISIYNHTSSSWIELPNSINDPNNRDTVSNFIETNNLTRDGLIDGAETLTLQFSDTLKNAGTNKKVEMDWVAAICNQFDDPEWTEVKGSSEMHISGDYRWVTNVESGQIFNATWPGAFHYNVTLSSQTAQYEEDELIYIEMPTPFPCHHVFNLTVDGVNTAWSPQNPDNPTTHGCRVEWTQDLNKSVNYDIQIIAENNFKQVESNWVTESAFDHSMIQLACKNYQTVKGYPAFEDHITEAPETQYQNDSFMAVCVDYLDTYNHWNTTYWTEFRTDQGIFTGADMGYLDEQWRHLEALTSRLQDESTNILGGLTTGGMYSGAIIANPTGQPIPVWATYWANASMPFINYVALSTMAATTNPATIAAAVWDMTTRTLTAFAFWEHEAAADYVWNSTTRNLTEASFDPVLIGDEVWNESRAKYTHGVVLN